MPGKNPFEDYADRTDTQLWLGQLLKFNKGDYVIGRDNEPCPETELEHVPPQLNQGDSRGAKDGRVYRH